jgi:ribosome-associated translation inhibitor RaiA
MTELDFTLEFRDEADLAPAVRDEMELEVDRRLRALRAGHTDITSAEAAIEKLVTAATPYLYEARVVVYMRPENVVATAKQETEIGALQGALSAVERQVREYRTKLAERWKQP